MGRRSLRDSQRSKCYAWERAAADRGEMSDEVLDLRQIEALVSAIWRRSRLVPHYVAVPRVLDGRGCRAAYSYGGAVGFPRAMRKRWVVCHEIAHEITALQYSHQRHADHGPEFVAIYIELLCEFAGGHRATLIGSARAGRLKFDESPLKTSNNLVEI